MRTRRLRLTRFTLLLTAGSSVALLLASRALAADVAIYNFNIGSAASSDTHAATTASNYDVRGIGMIDATDQRVEATGLDTGPASVASEGTLAYALLNNIYHSFSVNTNAAAIDFGTLGFNYTSIMPSGNFSVHVFSSATGFTADNRLAIFPLTGGGASPGNVAVDLTPYDALQAFNGTLEFRFYFVDFSAVATRIHTLDNIVVSEVGATWTSAAGGAWSNAANWSTTPDVPGVGALAGRDVVLGPSIASNSTVTLDTAVNVNRITFRNPSASYMVSPTTPATHTITLSGSAEVTAASGTHEIAARILGSNGLKKGGTGTVILSGANSYTGTTEVQAGSLRVRSLGSLPGAANVATGASLAFMGDIAHSGAGANGVLASALTGTGTVALNSSLTSETITINAAKSFDGLYEVSGGTLAVAHAGALGTGGTFAARTTVLGATGTGKVALTSNVAVASELLQLAARTTNAVHLTSAGTNAWSGQIDGTGTGQFNIESTSGTLTLAAALNAGDTDTQQRTFVFSGAGNIVVTGPITDDAIVWDASSAGVRTPSANSNINVTKRGAGTLTIATASSSASDYWKGATEIEQGTLTVTPGGGDSGELASRQIAVRSGAVFNVSGFGNYSMQIISDPDAVPSTGDEVGQILTGAGTVNATNLRAFDDSIIRPGDNGAGTMTVNGKLTVQSFTPNATGSLGFELSNVTTIGAGVNDLLHVNGNVQLDASGANVINVNVSPTAGNLAAGTYVLAQYTGTRTGSATAGNFAANVANAQGDAVGPSRLTLAVNLNDAAKRVELNVSGAVQTGTWTGSSGNQWDVNGATNWTTSDQKYFNLDNVVFNNTNAGSQFNVEIGEDVTPGAVTFNNTANAYTFTGAGGINGGGSVTLAGTGTVVFASARNIYSGTTTIGPGATLQIGNGASSGNHFGTGALVNNGTFIMNKAPNFGETIANTITGSGTIRVDSGVLTLTANNGYSGATIVNGGQLNVENLATATPLGTTGTGTTLNGGQLRINAQTATLNEPLTFGGGRLSVGGANLANITVAAPLTVGAGGGTIQLDSGTDVVNGLGARSNNGLTINSATSIASGGVLTTNVDSGSTLVLNGAITGAGGLRKSGAGAAELNVAAGYAGPTTVQGGSLKLIGAGNLASSQISVANAATLDTTAKGSPLSLASGQSLQLDGLTGPRGGTMNTPIAFESSLPVPAKLQGNVTATTGSQLGGIGTIAGSVTTQSGSVLRVGRAGINTEFSGTTQSENFESFAPGPAFTAGAATGLMPGWQFYDLGATTTDAAFAIQTPPEVVGASQMLAQTSFTTDLLENPTPIAGAVAISPLATGGTVDKISVDFTFDGGGDPDTNFLDSGVAFGFRNINNFFQLRLGRGASSGADARVELARIVNGQRIMEVETAGVSNFTSGFQADVIYTAEIIHDASTGYVSFSILNSSDAVVTSGHVVREGFREDGAVGVLVSNDYAAWDNLTVSTGSAVPDFGIQNLTIAGNLTMTGGTLELDIAGVDAFDVLNVSGALQAGGTLVLSLSDDYAPQIGDTFDVLNFGSISGSFALSLESPGDGLAWDTSQLLTTGILEVVESGGIDGDFNGDTIVDGADFLAWQRGVSTLYDGDDLNDWKANFGAGAATPASASVPEPEGVMLALLAAAGLAAICRRIPFRGERAGAVEVSIVG